MLHHRRRKAVQQAAGRMLAGTMLAAALCASPGAGAEEARAPERAAAPVHACAHNPDAMGTARTLTVDTSAGGDIGTMQYANTLPLGPKELVFTFDDGPNPEHTPKILDALDAHCIKATFFIVGRYAELHPEIVAETWRRGHTIATHTWSHPILSRVSRTHARHQIDRGIAATQRALAGVAGPDGALAQVAPFFRFPGLNDTAYLRRWLAGRGIATFSCDIGTDDWRRISPWTLKRRALSMIEAKGSGIVIFHDTHHRTSFMLPEILDELARRGYRAVHMVPGRGLGAVRIAEAPARTPAAAAPAPRIAAQPAAYAPSSGMSLADRLATAREADALTARALAASRAGASSGLRPSVAD